MASVWPPDPLSQTGMALEMANFCLAWGFGMESMGPMTVGTKDFGTKGLHPLAWIGDGLGRWDFFMIFHAYPVRPRRVFRLIGGEEFFQL